MKIKRTSFLARTAVTLLLAVLTSATAWADTWPEYITDVILVGGNSSEVTTAKNAHSDYTFIKNDLNEGTSGDRIYLGYKKSSSASVNGGYITDFVVVETGSSHNPSETFSLDGKTYYLCPYAGGDTFANDRHGNLTSQASGGKNMYLYYTKANFSDKRVVNDISFGNNKTGAINGYHTNGTLYEEGIDFNKGCGCGTYIYMHLSTKTKTNRPSVDPVMASGLVYNGSAKQLIATGATLASGTMYYRKGSSGDFTTTVANLKGTNAGNYTIQYYASSNDYSNQSDTHSATVNIAKSPNSDVTVSCSNILEGNAPAPSLVGNLSTGTVTYQYSTSQNGSYTTTVPSAAGTYWVKATIDGDGNCNIYTTAPVSFTIIYNWMLHNSGDTEADAYVISTTTDLNYLRIRVNLGNDFAGKFFKLGDNITFDKSKENNFTPIGNKDRHFAGIFDGQGKTISGININSNSAEYRGIFGLVSGTVKNLVVSNCSIVGYIRIGAIAGFLSSGTIENCRVSNDVTISGNCAVGGIVGVSSGGTIKGCTCAATITGTQASDINADTIGGVVGGVFSGGFSTLTDNIFTGTITGDIKAVIGAIIGKYADGALTNNYYIPSGHGGIGTESNAAGYDGDGARKALTISANDGVTITPTGTVTTYNVSGITAYADNSGISYGGKLYAGATEAVKLTLAYSGSVPVGYILGGYSATNGSTISGNATEGYTLTMPNADVTVSATFAPDFATYWHADADHDGTTEAKAYIITTTAGLDLLAKEVNSGKDYEGKYFKLDADITYDHTGLGETESNYTAIGGYYDSYYRDFRGIFDGQNHTVSGIRIYKGGTGNADQYQGLFGRISSPAEVKNVILADATITGYYYISGIVGFNYGKVENCHALDNVTVHAVQDNAWYHGGIAGFIADESIITYCTSAAALTDDTNSLECVGGIAGYNSGTVSHCLYLGTTLDGHSVVGAIVGINETNGTVETCYFIDTNIVGKDYSGAALAYSESAVGNNLGGNVATTIGPAHKVTFGEGVSTTVEATNWENGFTYGGNNYYREDLELPLTYSGSLPEGYILSFGAFCDNESTIYSAMGAYTLIMPTADVTVSAIFTPDFATYWHADDDHDGSTEAKAYIITTTTGLDLLAAQVNSGNDYEGKYFKLDADITYDHSKLGEYESNYTAIGGYHDGYYRDFKGHFDGDNHTISGIRIYKGGAEEADSYQGLFGRIYSTAEVKNVILADATITGYYHTGGIAGLNYGKVTNCHVLSTVTVHAVQNNVCYHGGIAGLINNNSFITYCTSAAALTDDTNSLKCVGGIAGYNSGTVSHCLYLGTTLGGHSDVGAIVGWNLNSVKTSYFTDTHIQGKDNAGNTLDNTISVGSNSGSVAYSGLAHKVTLDEGITLGDYATEYGLLTVYGNVVAMAYNDGTSTTIYSLAGSEISLNNYSGTMPEGYTYNYTATNGAPISGNATDGYTLTMPNTDVTVSATFMPDFATYWHADADHDGSTEAKAYIITTTAGLNLLAAQVNSGQDYNGKYFELGADITYDGTENNYTPIGTGFYVFHGNFDGKGHTVSGININQPETGVVGLFGNKSFGFVKNLTLANSTIFGNERVGGIVGFANDGVIENCHVASDVTVNGEEGYVGGIAGILQRSYTKGCTSAATVSGTDFVGGIAGYNNQSTIQDCLYTGSSVSGNQPIGAIVGYNSDGALTNNFHTVDGMGGVNGSDQDGARLAITTDTKPDTFGEATATYGTGDYTGITAYGTNGLAYGGKYYGEEQEGPLFTPGDANGDGQVTITDAVAIVDYILGNEPENFNKAAANVSGDVDGKGEPVITITDAVGVVDIILNSGPSSTPKLDIKEPEPMVEPE